MKSNVIQQGYYNSPAVKIPTRTEAREDSKNPDKISDAQAAANDLTENQDTVMISSADDEGKTFSSGVQKGNFNVETSKPEDKSGDLTKRLVAAFGQFEVRQILAEANTSLVKLRMLSGMSSGKDKELADAYIKKIEKLINRANKKIDGLDKEDMMKLRQMRAEQKKQDKLAEEIKTELRKQKQMRKQKEQNYLNENLLEEMFGKSGDFSDSTKLDSASEAEIAIQAEAMAAAEMAMSSDGGDFAAPALDISVGVETGGGEAATSEISIEA